MKRRGVGRASLFWFHYLWQEFRNMPPHAVRTRCWKYSHLDFWPHWSHNFLLSDDFIIFVTTYLAKRPKYFARFFSDRKSSGYVPYFCLYDKLRISGKCLMSNFQKLFQMKLNPEIFRFLTWNLEKVVKPINKSIKFPSVLEPPTLQNKSNSKGAFLYLCEIILEVPF